MAQEQNQDAGIGTDPQGTLAIDTPGAKLRHAREQLGLSLPDVATTTRVAMRQLESIERDDYAALPGIPYAVGFARSYARAVGLDEVMIAREVREAVSHSDLGSRRHEIYEPADPARVPSRTLAWTAAAIALAVIIGFGVWRAQLLTPPTEQEQASVAQDATPAAGSPAVAQAAPAPTSGPVVFTAVDDVWMRIYDETGTRLKDGLMKKGESFTLPANAQNPMILTGRPQALTVTVGGKAIAPLGPPDRTIADVPVSAGALLARAAAPAAAGAVTATPAPAPQRPALQRPSQAAPALEAPVPTSPAPAPAASPTSEAPSN